MKQMFIGYNQNVKPLSASESANVAPTLSTLPDALIDPQGMPKILEGTAPLGENIGQAVSYNFAGFRNTSNVVNCEVGSKAHIEYHDPQNYDRVSMMSLDGLFSPVSFYPTRYNSTYSITKFNRSECPYCRGNGVIQNNRVPNPKVLENINFVEVGGQQAVENQMFVSYNSPCLYCLPDATKAEMKKANATTSEIFPPYLVGEGGDSDIYSDPESVELAAKINKFNLNPIVTTDGEFSLSSLKNPTDNCSHSINSVAFGHTPPVGGGTTCGNASNQSNKNYSGKDLGLERGQWANNQRFFALRGPLMVHGWGYDLEGYPIPNASGEPKVTQNGDTVKTADGAVVYRNQELQPDGTWSDPYKEHKFRQGWASLPASWPVGPIDLRWDDNAGVWTVGSNYKQVWITIEIALSSTTPVRGVIEDDVSEAKPLPEGKRRLVFVKDPTGLFRAPRGAALYCKYNTQNGFYEPIYNQPFLTTGEIKSGNTADIDNTYTLRYSKDKISEKYDGEIFSNPLNLPTRIGRKGIFTFMAGKWTLTSVEG